MRLRGLIGPLLAMLISILLFEYIRSEVGHSMDVHLRMPKGHFYIVTSVSILATILAIAVGIVGSRLRNIQVSFLSLAFISLAEMFAIHGLSTPGFIMHNSPVPAIAAQLSILLASFWLCLSSLSSDHAIVRYLSLGKSRLVWIWTIFLGAFGTIGMMYPQIVEFIPLNQDPLNGTVAGITILFNLVAIYRYYQSYRFSRFPLQISIIYSSSFFIVAQYIIVKGVVWHVSWWLYHIILLAAMLIMLFGLYRQYAANKSINMALKALFTTDPIERVTTSLSPSIKYKPIKIHFSCTPLSIIPLLHKSPSVQNAVELCSNIA